MIKYLLLRKFRGLDIGTIEDLNVVTTGLGVYETKVNLGPRRDMFSYFSGHKKFMQGLMRHLISPKN